MRGQVIHLNLDMKPARYQEATTVVMQPPIKPSHVFLGESCINFLCPKHIPAAKPLSKFGKSCSRQLRCSTRVPSDDKQALPQARIGKECL